MADVHVVTSAETDDGYRFDLREAMQLYPAFESEIHRRFE